MRALRRAWATLSTGPSYPAEPADLRTITLVGLELPLRASMAIAVVTLAVLVDLSGSFVPRDLGDGPVAMLYVGIRRAVLFGFVPLAVVLVVFRDRPSRYGLTPGDWRLGLTLVAVGCAVMTPIVVWFATLPDARAYYAPHVASLGQLLLTNGLDLTASEFLYRGFLMLALVRVIGPLGVLVATMPFVFAHLGKPELELFSTLGGGLVYGWLAWRTRSILWGSIGHVYIVTLVTLAAASGP